MTAYRLSPELAMREQFPRLLMTRVLIGQAAEIGTHRGLFARDLFLGGYKPICLHLVDPWTNTSESPGNRKLDQQFCMLNLAPHCERVCIHEMTSEQAAKEAPDNLDFVYIDGLHTYDAVALDMRLWWPKLSKFGILAGHDFSPRIFPGIVKAVGEFCAAHAIRDVYLSHDVDYKSWYFYRNQDTKPYRWYHTVEIDPCQIQ